MDETDGYNDRCILYLLTHKENKTDDDLAVMFILKNRYPDWDIMYQDEISSDMKRRGFIGLIDVRPELPERDKHGSHIGYDSEKYKTITTERGLNAMRFGLLSSEYKKINEDRNKNNLQITDLALSIKERKRDQFLSWSAFFFSIIAIIISVMALIK